MQSPLLVALFLFCLIVSAALMILVMVMNPSGPPETDDQDDDSEEEDDSVASSSGEAPAATETAVPTGSRTRHELPALPPDPETDSVDSEPVPPPRAASATSSSSASTSPASAAQVSPSSPTLPDLPALSSELMDLVPPPSVEPEVTDVPEAGAVGASLIEQELFADPDEDELMADLDVHFADTPDALADPEPSDYPELKKAFNDIPPEGSSGSIDAELPPEIQQQLPPPNIERVSDAPRHAASPGTTASNQPITKQELLTLTDKVA
ncbi:MAG: hypothetical protein N2C14_29135, partial [Planctomycetales bacterium]